VCQQAEELRRRKIFGDVREAFWKQEPKLLEVIGELKTARVFFVPMFVSEGYFSEGVIPKAIGFQESKVQSPKSKVEGAKWFYCKAVGTHERMRDVLLSRAREVVKPTSSIRNGSSAEHRNGAI